MIAIDFGNAYYIKLGRGGEWERDSIATGKIRFGWRHQSIVDINAKCWELIESQLREKDHGKRIPATTSDFNALMIIAKSDADDIWITFHQSKLWWTRVAPGEVQKDEISKFRITSQPWSDRASDGKLLAVTEIPGKISQIQGFRATFCRVKPIDLLRRTINGTSSELSSTIRKLREQLSHQLTSAIKELHWKDFETLVDLVFRAAGWVRVSVLGQHEKAYDLLLREPVTGNRSVVQVKSKAGRKDLDETITSFSAKDFRRVFFVVHSPERTLVSDTCVPSHVELILPARLGELAMDAGLAGWLADKVT